MLEVIGIIIYVLVLSAILGHAAYIIGPPPICSNCNHAYPRPVFRDSGRCKECSYKEGKQ